MDSENLALVLLWVCQGCDMSVVTVFSVRYLLF